MTNTSDTTRANPAEDDPYLEQLVDFLRMNAAMERGFGPATALLQYGKIFEPADANPAWIARGPAKQCFDNATKVLISRLAAGDTAIRYAEGYAMDMGLPIPIQHAWLVDADNNVIDPTWCDAPDNLYFGIVFETKFVLDMIGIKKSAGILVDAVGMRRNYGSKQLFVPGIHHLAA
ncbi:hypothetical protein GCM10011491_46940 [Brucella endophytica]|uniref:Uncharacterized protein n=1 Tax=Brucella endophytica TaxID=1963359 RepID=A0A916SU53_9HYPH|nr:hypothetical protein [Brucella endophytica]GGB13913.1 hypothetical protein GCM10011491_46940 [Brucella endophytica]